jgi:hypothetical protein
MRVMADLGALYFFGMKITNWCPSTCLVIALIRCLRLLKGFLGGLQAFMGNHHGRINTYHGVAYKISVIELHFPG